MDPAVYNMYKAVAEAEAEAGAEAEAYHVAHVYISSNDVEEVIDTWE